MIATTLPPADLLTQISALITATETVSADAEKWRELIRKLQDVGYGPRLNPDQIAYLIPSARYVAEIVTASQEAPPTAAPKSNGTGKRRVITDADRTLIVRSHTAGMSIQDIIRDLGYSKSTIERTLHLVADRDAA